MTVDDHAIDSLRVYFDVAYEELKKEWKGKEYLNLSECPSFKATTSYREALNILIEGCYLPEYADKFKIAPLKRKIDGDLEIEEYWENRK